MNRAAVSNLPDTRRQYVALCARDARFDGRLFVGVTSTGIYCRPVCRVRTPQRRNCRFFATAAGAEQAGFRPCLRCRPELAPGLSFMDSSASLADHAARQLAGAVAGRRGVSIPAVAARLGVTDRHLRRIFQAAHGVTPVAFLTTHRLLLAKQLLTDTRLPVSAIADASGFGSLRRFNAVFRSRYRLTPTKLRRGAAPIADAQGLQLRLAYRPPCDHAGLMRFFGARAVAGLETRAGDVYRRTLSVPGDRDRRDLQGWLALRFASDRPEVELEVDPALAPVLSRVLQRVRLALDLDAEPAVIDAALGKLGTRGAPGLRVPGSFDSFEGAVRVILGQQISVAAAGTLTTRLVARFGAPVKTPWPALTTTFPSARVLAEAPVAALAGLGIVRQRAEALRRLAREVAAGNIRLDPLAPLEPTLDALRALPGIGEWTVQLIALRSLAWPDAFPGTDLGVMKALGTRNQKRVQALAERWRPWRAYAVLRLWQSLEKRT